MKNFLFIILVSFFFVSCSSKIQEDILDSSKNDVSNLLNKLIEKEKEINRLNKKLEECQSFKK